MRPLRLRPAHPWAACALLCGLAVALSGCASPGPPRPPSLQLPKVVSDLAAARAGEVVELRFTAPDRTTDGQAIRSATVSGALCRQVGSGGPCTPVGGTDGAVKVSPEDSPQPVVWTDTLPQALASGPARVIGYRVELRNSAGRSAGWSEPAYTLAGAAPAPVVALRAVGTREGVELNWTPRPGEGEVLVERTAVSVPAGPGGIEAPVGPASKARGFGSGAAKAGGVPGHKKAEARVVWLQAAPGDASAAATMDATALEGVAYRYVAVRRRQMQTGGRTLEVRSARSAPVTITWEDVYPPAAPVGLTGLGYTVPAEASPAPGAGTEGYAVDLVWQPVEDARLAGYAVYRQALNAAGEAIGARTRLNPEPVVTPGFHDATAGPTVRYRYSVTAMDAKGNESAAAEAVVEASGLP